MEDTLEKFIKNRKGDYIKKDVLEKLDEQVDKTLKAYKTDWTVHDRDRIEDSAANSRFVCMLRDTGCDTMFLSGKYFDLGNLEYSSNSFKAHNSKKYLYYDGKKLREIPKDKVKKLNEEAWKSLPQEYIDAYERKDESAQGSFADWCEANRKRQNSFAR